MSMSSVAVGCPKSANTEGEQVGKMVRTEAHVFGGIPAADCD